MEGWASNERRVSFLSHRFGSEFRTADDDHEFDLRDFRQSNSLQPFIDATAASESQFRRIQMEYM